MATLAKRSSSPMAEMLDWLEGVIATTTRVTVAATHGLFVGPALERLAACKPRRVVVTDSLPQPAQTPFPLDVVSVATAWAECGEVTSADRSLSATSVRTVRRSLSCGSGSGAR